MTARALAIGLLLLGACSDPGPTPSSEPVLPADATPLHVPPAMIARARREAFGLERLPESGRVIALQQGRSRVTPSYADLRERANVLTDTRANYVGQLALVRGAGTNLWIAALMTRADGAHWRDPIYVLSVVDLLPLQGQQARIDAWIVGERTIGQHALPLIVAFHVEPAS